MTNSWSFEITPEDVGRRIDNFLRFKIEASRNQLYYFIRVGKIKVNKRKVKVDYRLQLEDQIVGYDINLKNHRLNNFNEMRNEKKLLSRIVYEDKRFLLINKPAGIAVHGGSGISLGIIESLRKFYPKVNLSLVHRLDKSTSGGLLIAKRSSTLRLLNELIREHKIRKYYLVLVKGRLAQKKLTVELPLLKRTDDFREHVVEVNKNGKLSTTIFKVLEEGEHCSLLEAELKTGRTHQIRVHAAHSGFPVVGDRKYGDKAFNQIADKFGYHRLYLHSYRLVWQMADDAQKFDFVIPTVENFTVF